METAERVTIGVVAERAGVSVATVSKVLNDRWGVAPATRARVREAIDELGYDASLVAQGLAKGRTNVIGILAADFESFGAELVKGAVEALHRTRYELVVYSACKPGGEAVGWEQRYLSRLAGTLMDGAILVTPTVEQVRYGRPVVAVDAHTGQSFMPSVVSDNLAGAKLAVEHLIGLGHRRIAMLRGREGLESAALREAGYRQAMAEAGIPVDESLVLPGAYSPGVARGSADELLGLADRPTAVFATNDRSALATLASAKELGVAVPAELSVIGFDNIPESAVSEPRLTTIRQPIAEMGAIAVELLVGLIEERPTESPHVVLPTELVLRDSTCPPGEPFIVKEGS